MKVMKAIDWKKSSPSVDIRKLKNGKIRLRFRLSKAGIEIVTSALELASSLTGYKTKGGCLDIISMSYLAGSPSRPRLTYLAQGKQRLLAQLFNDQYETVRLALDEARNHTSSDSEALVLIAQNFLETETTMTGT